MSAGAPKSEAVSQAFFHFLLEGSSDGILLLDEALSVVELNTMAKTLFGLPDAVEGLTLTDLLTDHAAQRVLQSLRSNEKTHWSQSIDALRQDGVVLPIDVTFHRLSVGMELWWAVLLRDITARRLAELALQRSESRFRDLIEQMPDGIVVHRDGRFQYVNPALVEMLHYPGAEDLLQRPVLDMLHADDRDVAEGGIRDMLRTGKAAPRRELRLIRYDGSFVVTEVMSLPIPFDGGRSILALIRDVTERTEMQAQLLQSDRMASMGLLAAGVAHEVFNPLAYITVNLDYARDELRSRDQNVDEEAQARDAELSNAVEEAREGVERVRAIVQDLKSFSKPTSGTRAFVDVERVLQAALNIAGAEVRQKARLVTQYEHVGRVLADEARLGQVFLNLVLNAAQAFEHSDPQKQRIEVLTKTDSHGSTIVEVSDNGPGISPAVRARIFEPFFTTKETTGGTGLGLFISQGIIDDMGGVLSLDSALGEGTTFRVSFPIVEELDIEGGVATEEISIRHRARVLIIDDEPALAAALRRVLARDYEVQAVNRGQDGLDLLVADPSFDLVFCDLMMPEMTGMEVFRRLRDRCPGREERIVFMSGGAFTLDAEAFLEEVSNTHIEKPIDMRLLKTLARERLSLQDRS